MENLMNTTAPIRTAFGLATPLQFRRNWKGRLFVQIRILQGTFAGKTTWIPSSKN